MRSRLRAFLDVLSQGPAEPLEPDDELFDPDAHLTKAERARRHTERRRNRQRILAEDPNHPTVEHIVDNRVFLVGLDQLYRTRMKRHESTELLTCARAVAATLNVPPAEVPIEGYYGETRRLTEYFRLIRNESVGRVAARREFQRLTSVMAAPLYGRPVRRGHLFPVGYDSLTQALDETGGDLSRLTIGNIVDRAYHVAIETEDFSLVGLASFVRDAVILAALRESVVLYAGVSRFFPEPVEENADLFFDAADEDEIYGRCVRIAEVPGGGVLPLGGMSRGRTGDRRSGTFGIPSSGQRIGIASADRRPAGPGRATLDPLRLRMSTKREERKQRADVHRLAQEQLARRKTWRSRAMFAVGVLAVLAAVFMATRGPKDGEERNGRVWSAAHGHWHDKYTGRH
jgi:hypothetical protein